MGMEKYYVVLAVGLMAQVGCRKFSEGSKLKTSTEDSSGLSGTYAKQIIFANKSSAAGLNITTKTERLQLVKLTQDGGRIDVKATTCSLKSVSNNGNELTFPEAFVKSIPVFSYVYTMDSTGAAPSLKSNDLLEVFGARLGDGAQEALPKSRNDSRVFDQDRDGHPGMSVNLRVGIGPFKAAGQVYIVQRVAWKETATKVTSDTVSGTLDIQLEQVTLGSDSSILGAVSAKVEALPNLSSFAMKKLPEGATCDTIVRDGQRLFGELKL